MRRKNDIREPEMRQINIREADKQEEYDKQICK